MMLYQSSLTAIFANKHGAILKEDLQRILLEVYLVVYLTVFQIVEIAYLLKQA